MSVDTSAAFQAASSFWSLAAPPLGERVRLPGRGRIFVRQAGRPERGRCGAASLWAGAAGSEEVGCIATVLVEARSH